MHLSRRDVMIGLAGLGLDALGGAPAAAEINFFPHNPPNVDPLTQRNRFTMAHWHFFPLSIDNKPVPYDYYTRQFLTVDGEGGKHASFGGYLRDRPIPIDVIPQRQWQVEAAAIDINLAIAAGVDAFQFNIPSFDPKSGYPQRLQALLEAIERDQIPFRVAPCLDCTLMNRNTPVGDLVAALKPLLQHSGALRLPDGRPMLSCFVVEAWPIELWRALLGDLERAGIKVYFAPMVLDPGKASRTLIDLADMIGWWAGNFIDGIAGVRSAMREVRARGKAVMWPVWPQDCRPKSGIFWEARNTEVFRTGWEAAIDEQSDCVNILTWNDYAESSQLRPSVGTQYLFADINRYYADWYRSGRQPDIVRDVLYYCHRRDFTDAQHSAVAGKAAMRLTLGRAPVNEVELVAFLTSAGTISISNGAGTARREVSAGIQTLRVPLTPGAQMFHLARRDENLLTVDSPFVVREKWDWQDLTYRGGSSSRPPVVGTSDFSRR